MVTGDLTKEITMTQYVLHVYLDPLGWVIGRLFTGEEEIYDVSGCATINEAREVIENTGQRVDFVVDGITGKGL